MFLKKTRVGVLLVVPSLALAGACNADDQSMLILGDVCDGPCNPPVFGSAADAEAGPADVEVPLCIATDCRPPYATCEGEVHRCGTNLTTDRKNCGSCGRECEIYRDLDIVGRCVKGKCVYDCTSTFEADCNGLVDDGCEVYTWRDPKNCGACGNECDPGEACVNGKCGCPLGQTYCSGGCINLTTDSQNCNECGRVCPDWRSEGLPDPPTNMTYGCGGGRCGQLGCVQGFADCDGDPSNGCERYLVDEASCGSCDYACAPGETCAQNADTNNVECMCPQGLVLCQGNGSTCRDLLNDREACGACDNACSVDASGEHMEADCISGRCEAMCVSGYADCDGNWVNGCETNLRSDPGNCGQCGFKCSEDQPCIEGKCHMQPCGVDGGTTR